jgi:hypothetical protein
MLPLRIILILGILFLLVLCCMIAAQLSIGPMPITEDEVVRSVELAVPPKLQSPLARQWQEARL